MIETARINANESAPRGNKTGSMCDFIGVPYSLFPSYLHDLTEILLKHPITNEIYNALMIGFLSKPIDLIGKNNTIINHLLLKPLFDICGHASLEILLHFMADIKELITIDKNAANNRKAIFTLPHWQHQFLQFFHMLFGRKSEFEQTGKVNVQQISLLMCDLMNFIHLDSLHRENLDPLVRVYPFEESLLYISVYNY